MPSFIIPGVPLAQPRARATLRGSHSAIYQPRTPCDAWKATIAAVAGRAISAPLDGAVVLTMAFILPRPKGHYGAKGLRPSAPETHTARPDLDNLCKAVMDALKGIAWRDDAQVVELSTQKVYESPNRAIGALVSIHSRGDAGLHTNRAPSQA